MYKTNKTAQQAYKDFEAWLNKGKAPNPWCPANVAGCALGYGYFVGYPSKIWNVSVWVAIAKKDGVWRGATNGKFGDAVVFDWSGGKSRTDHVGFFIKEDAGNVWHISANSGSSGLVRINKTSKKYVTGYGTVVEFKAETVNTPEKPVEAPVKPAKPPVKPVDDPKPVIPVTAPTKAVYLTVNRGDGYWILACRALSVPNKPRYYAQIAAKSAQIQVWNKKRALHTGDTVRVG
jgi:hypothetical protein